MIIPTLVFAWDCHISAFVVPTIIKKNSAVSTAIKSLNVTFNLKK